MRAFSRKAFLATITAVVIVVIVAIVAGIIGKLIESSVSSERVIEALEKEGTGDRAGCVVLLDTVSISNEVRGSMVYATWEIGKDGVLLKSSSKESIECIVDEIGSGKIIELKGRWSVLYDIRVGTETDRGMFKGDFEDIKSIKAFNGVDNVYGTGDLSQIEDIFGGKAQVLEFFAYQEGGKVTTSLTIKVVSKECENLISVTVDEGVEIVTTTKIGESNKAIEMAQELVGIEHYGNFDVEIKEKDDFSIIRITSKEV